MANDVAFLVDANGKLKFARNSDGDFYFDDRAVYAVIATLSAEKNRYLWDSAVGTYLSQIKQDVRATGTRLVGAATDALEQLRGDGLIRGGSATAERLRLGSWALIARWQTPSGMPATSTVRT